MPKVTYIIDGVPQSVEFEHGTLEYSHHGLEESLLDIAKEFLEIAWEGLRRQNQVNDLGDDETIYLKPLKDLLALGKCPADLLLEKWEGELHHDIKRLIAYSAYKLP